MEQIQVRRMAAADEQVVDDILGFAFADQPKRAPAYLETDRELNLAFYKRFRFAVVAEENILGVRNWYMWREPTFPDAGSRTT